MWRCAPVLLFVLLLEYLLVLHEVDISVEFAYDLLQVRRPLAAVPLE